MLFRLLIKRLLDRATARKTYHPPKTNRPRARAGAVPRPAHWPRPSAAPPGRSNVPAGAMALLLQLQGCALLVLRYFADMLHLSQLYELAFSAFMRVVELDLVPDFVLRRGIRFLLHKRLADVRQGAARCAILRAYASTNDDLEPALGPGSPRLAARPPACKPPRSRHHPHKTLRAAPRRRRCPTPWRTSRPTRCGSWRSCGCCRSRCRRPPPTSSTTRRAAQAAGRQGR
jgi:hypothetical protein